MRNVKLLSAAVLATTALGTALPVVANAAGPLPYNTKAGVTFIANDGPVNPVDPNKPEDPSNPVNPGGDDHQPGTNGPLSIDYVSDFDFGTQKITSTDQTYNAKAQYYKDTADGQAALNPTVLFAQVTDNRGNGAGWNLTVQQPKQLNNGTEDLAGAAISIKDMNTNTQSGSQVAKATAGANATLVPAGGAQVVMNAAANAGQGTWVDRFGTDANNLADETGTDANGADRKVDNAVTLFVPGAANKMVGAKYSTDLIWTLNDTPANTTDPTA